MGFRELLDDVVALERHVRRQAAEEARQAAEAAREEGEEEGGSGAAGAADGGEAGAGPGGASAAVIDDSDEAIAADLTLDYLSRYWANDDRWGAVGEEVGGGGREGRGVWGKKGRLGQQM